MKSHLESVQSYQQIWHGLWAKHQGRTLQTPRASGIQEEQPDAACDQAQRVSPILTRLDGSFFLGKILLQLDGFLLHRLEAFLLLCQLLLQMLGAHVSLLSFCFGRCLQCKRASISGRQSATYMEMHCF